MATAAAPLPPLGRLDHHELRRFLNALRLQLWWREALVVLAFSAVVGAFIGAALFTFWITLAVVAVGLVLAVVRRPSTVRAARAVDRQLSTASRLATAAEVLDGRLGGALASAQLDDAWHTASMIRPWRAYPRGWRRVQFAVLALIASVVVMGLSLNGVVEPLVVPSALIGDQSGAQAQDTAAADADVGAADANADTADQSMNPALPSTLQELQTQAAQSQAAQTALQKLASALRPTAAARDIGDALRAGNYDDAATKLATLAQQSDQLSRISKRELASAMERAAIDSANDDAPLAVSEDRVARALTRGVYSETRSTLNDLAKAVGDAKQGVISQEALAQELAQLQQEKQQPQAPGGGGGDIGESDQGYIPDIPGDQPQQAGIVQGIQSSISIPGPEGDPKTTQHSGVGTEAGADPIGDLTSRLDVQPVDVNVDAQLANDQGRNKASPNAPVVKISDASQNGVQPSDVVRPGDPVQDVAERVVEPTEQRSAVRTFFNSNPDTSNGSQPATTNPAP